MNPTTVLINGALGKMGKLAAQLLEQQPHFTVIAKLSRNDNLSQALATHNPDITLDLTRANVVYENSKMIIEANSRPIIGTSGLQQSQIQQLQEHCKKQQLGGIIVPNFSLAAILMMHFAATAARFLPETNVEIIEQHHPSKADSPSATAIRTAELIAQQKDFPLPSNGASRGQNYFNIPIHALRLEGSIAQQQIHFASPFESLKITHDTHNRQAFMQGLLLACQKVLSLDHLVYGLEQLIPWHEV
jgi:4-hydroxy-tetrahydrodipicolinate reductase